MLRHLTTDKAVTLLDAMGVYVGTIKTNVDSAQAQQELLRFVNWCGADRAIVDVKPVEIGDYGDQAVGRTAESLVVERLQEVRKFLSFAKKKGLTDQNLATHLRIRKGKTRGGRGTTGTTPKAIELTPQGHSELISELEGLKGRRAPLAAEIRLAAADKDVRENAPLEAVREQLGHVESRIGQIEATLKAAVVVDPSKSIGKAVATGSRVVLRELTSGRQTKYTLVSAAEANSLGGKISDVSPVGRAMLARVKGDEFEVESPRGTLHYRILRVS